MKRFLVAFATSCAIVAACDDNPETHVYVAAQYDPIDVCFGPSISLGVIDTSTGDLDCAPTCLVLSTGDGTAKTYVSTMCGPYPAQYDTSQTDPSCAPALAAWPAEQAALANGSNSCASPEDAGTEDGGSDGGETDDSGTEDSGSDGGSAADASDAGDAGAVDGG